MEKTKPTKRKAVFLIFHCDAFGDSPSFRFLIATRWSGSFGFIGGCVNEGEDLTETLVRECQEEIGYDISKEKNRLKFVNEVFYEEKNMSFVTYSLKLSEQEIKKALTGWLENGDFAEYEISGLSLIRADEKTMINFLKNNFAGTSKVDLLTFMENNK